MKLDWAMLCTAAEARDGLAYIIGGGWDTTGRGEFPSVFVGGIVIRLQFRPEEMGGHQLRLAARNEVGEPVGEAVEVAFNVDLPDNLPEGWDANSLISVTLNGLPLPAPGNYAFDIEVDGALVRTLPFRVLQTPGAGHAT